MLEGHFRGVEKNKLKGSTKQSQNRKERNSKTAAVKRAFSKRRRFGV